MSDSNRMSRWAQLVPLPIFALLAGCFGHLTPAGATMAGLDAPVLLGPIDHVGGGKPLTTSRVGEFEATAKHVVTNNDSGGYTYTVDSSESSMGAEAEYATRNDKYKDIRLTEVKPQAVGVISGVKSRVDVEGDVVKVKPTKGAGK
jgi:hypothetical protein